MITIETLFSGFLGAIIAILYQRYRDKNEKEYYLAKDRLEKIYGPLLLIYDANKGLNKSGKEEFLYGEEEENRIDEILLHNYALIEEERRSILLDLYGHRKFSGSVSNDDVVNAIKTGYNDNLTIISQKSIISKIKDSLNK